MSELLLALSQYLDAHDYMISGGIHAATEYAEAVDRFAAALNAHIDARVAERLRNERHGA